MSLFLWCSNALQKKPHVPYEEEPRVHAVVGAGAQTSFFTCNAEENHVPHPDQRQLQP